MKEVKKTLFIFFIVTILLVNLVNADIFSYNTKSSSQALCPRESGLFIDTITNVENIERFYNIKLTGSASEWSTSLPNSFVLKPGENKDVYTYSTPRHEIKPGSYGINIEITSNDITKTIKHFVEVKNCYKTEIISSIQSISTCPSQSQVYNVNIINKGEADENYVLSLDDGIVRNNIKLSDTIFSLSPNQQKTVYIFVTAPQESLEYKFKLLVQGTRNKLEYPLTLNVLPCYDFKFTPQGSKEYNVCDRTVTIVPFRLENSGTTSNQYNVKVEGPVWIRTENINYDLLPSESKIVNTAFAPGYGVNGTYEIKVSAVPTRGNAKIVNTFNINVRKCHSLDLELLQNNVKTCKTVNNGYNFKIKNTGEIQKIVNINLEGKEWINLEGDSKLVLKPGEIKILNLNANPGENIKNGNYNIKIKVSANDESDVISKDEEILNLEVVDLNGCYQGAISTLYDNIIVYYDSNTAIPVNIKNEGLKKADYRLSLIGNASKFIRLNPNTLSLEPGKEEIVYLYIAPGISAALGKYESTLNVNLLDGQLLGTRKFEIEITDQKEKVTPILLNQTIDDKDSKKYLNKTKDFIKNYKMQLILIILLIILLVLAGILGWYDKVIKFFEEDEEIENKTKKIKKKEDKKSDDIKKGVGE